MIRITIERVATKQTKETKQFQLTEEPTQIKDGSSSYGERVTYKKTWEPREIKAEITTTTLLLKQEIESEPLFSLSKVIAAINGLAQS